VLATVLKPETAGTIATEGVTKKEGSQATARAILITEGTPAV
jgi:hypothetical protein